MPVFIVTTSSPPSTLLLLQFGFRPHHIIEMCLASDLVAKFSGYFSVCSSHSEAMPDPVAYSVLVETAFFYSGMMVCPGDSSSWESKAGG